MVYCGRVYYTSSGFGRLIRAKVRERWKLKSVSEEDGVIGGCRGPDYYFEALSSADQTHLGGHRFIFTVLCVCYTYRASQVPLGPKLHSISMTFG